MWEDNNPLSFDRRSSTSSFSPSGHPYGISPPSATYHPGLLSSPGPNTGPSHPDELDDTESPQASIPESGHNNSDDDDDFMADRPGGYNFRVEQVLSENKDLAILITDAGKNNDGGAGGYIVYTIRTGDVEVRRRYSEFESLRKNLALLHPCLIIPPIPEKHTLADYATAPRHAKDDIVTIELRKRMLGVFLNRCLRMKEIRRDSVFARFLDPNASWSEVLASPPISNLPKQHLRAPPSNPANPTLAHPFLPIPAGSAKLKAAPVPIAHDNGNPYANRFPPLDHTLSEPELDPYFSNYESTTREYESLLTTSIEKVNRRILKRLAEWSTDYSELGARYNEFSLSEQETLASAIERIGQAVDSSYVATEELARVLNSSFAEPLRESAQFAGVVRSVLRYRVMKRLQEEMTRDQLARTKAQLEDLERSEQEARRIEQHITREITGSMKKSPPSDDRDDVESIDSGDFFPPTHSEVTARASSAPSSNAAPKRSQSTKSSPSNTLGRAAGAHKKASSVSTPVSPSSSTTLGMVAGNGLFSKISGRLSFAMNGIVDVDPEKTRRDNIGKTKERLVQLEQALAVAEKDVKDASSGVMKDLRRFQKEKEGDLRRMMITYAKCHIEWAKKNLETWEEAKAEVDKIKAG